MFEIDHFDHWPLSDKTLSLCLVWWDSLAQPLASHCFLSTKTAKAFSFGWQRFTAEVDQSPASSSKASASWRFHQSKKNNNSTQRLGEGKKNKASLHPSKILVSTNTRSQSTKLSHDLRLCILSQLRAWHSLSWGTRKPTPSGSTMFHQPKKNLQMQAMLPLAQCQEVCWSMPETWVDECNGPGQWGCSRFYYPNNGHCLSAFFIQISCPKPYDNRLGKVHLVDFGGGHLNFKAMPPANTARRTAIFKGRWWLEHERP